MKPYYKDWVVWCVLIISVGAFVLAADMQLFETVFQYTRDHEDWELDEYFSLTFILPVVLPLLLYRANRQLRSALAAKNMAEVRASHIALHDHLTGLPNRRHFRAMIGDINDAATRGRGARRITVMMIDLDHFKPINDLRGHEVGDRLLVEVAQRLQRLVGEKGEVMRLGGDEFVAIFHSLTDDAADQDMAHLVIDQIARPFVVSSFHLTISCSIGIAQWLPGMTEADLLRRADQAMYLSKAAGRASASRYSDALGARLHDEAALQSDLRQAVAENAIVPYYQPIYDLKSRRLTGVEVLSRWHHPGRGFVRPDVFIKVAETLGLLDQLSDRVLDQACADLRGWSAGLDISFNLSPSQFSNPNLAMRIAALLDKHDLPGTRLEIEITETAVLADLDHARKIINQLAALGVRIALDDFGTGTSSLATLANLPFSKLKIDRQFISGVHQSTRNAKIVQGVLALAESLDICVTAEGIELPEELAFLRERACMLGQGYLLCRPQPASEIARLLINDKTLRKSAVA